MRDSYVADVGDFGKYALLNALAGSDLRLGVLWCRNSEPEGSVYCEYLEEDIHAKYTKAKPGAAGVPISA